MQLELNRDACGRPVAIRVRVDGSGIKTFARALGERLPTAPKQVASAVRTIANAVQASIPHVELRRDATGQAQAIVLRFGARDTGIPSSVLAPASSEPFRERARRLIQSRVALVAARLPRATLQRDAVGRQAAIRVRFGVAEAVAGQDRIVAAEPQVWAIDPVAPGMAATARELQRYRRLLWFFAVQSIKGMYEGTSLGVFWLFARPLLPIFISAFVFGRLLNVPSDGLPYFLFFLTGTSIWMLFERSLLWATRSLDMQRSVIKKLYFPRLLVPMASVAPALAYFGIYMALIVAAAIYYLVKEGRWYLALGPGWIVACGAVALSVVLAVVIGLFTCVWQVRHREVRYGLRYAMRFWFYLTPVIYPMSQVPPKLHWVIYLNPMAAFVETFKWGLLGVGLFPVLPLLSSFAVILVAGALGVWYFSRSEAGSIDEM